MNVKGIIAEYLQLSFNNVLSRGRATENGRIEDCATTEMNKQSILKKLC